MLKEINVQNLHRTSRFDQVLATVLPDLTRSTSKKIILQGIATLNSVKVKPNAKVKNGDNLQIDLDEVKKFIDSNDMTEIIPTKMDIDIIYEDDNTIVVNKKEGVVVHPVYTHKDDTLLNGLIYYVIHNEKNPFIRIRPVNRLDKDTSGILLFSKNLESQNFYSRQFKKREVQKSYMALVKGSFQEYLYQNHKEKLTINNYLTKDPVNRKYKSTTSDKGDYAETDFFFKGFSDEDEQYSLVIAQPKTGRTHQIRIHLADIGFPIIGDILYGGENYSRLMLHSWKLKLRLYDPNVQIKNLSEEKEFEASIPQSFIRYKTETLN